VMGIHIRINFLMDFHGVMLSWIVDDLDGMMIFFMGCTLGEVGCLLGRVTCLGGGAVGILKEGIEPWMTWGHLVACMEICDL
jgi:hypothetical protein